MSTTVAAPPQTPPPKAAPQPAAPPVVPAVPTPLPLHLSTGPQLHALTVQQYQQMIERGILTESDKVELLEGHLVRKIARNPPHDGTMDDLEDILRPLLPPGWIMRIQKSIELPTSQPEPDIAVVRGGRGTYRTRHPVPADLGFLIEVSDSSLRFDRAEKVRVYATASVPEYWIINVPDQRIEVYTQPSGPTAVPGFGSLQTYAPGQAVPLTLDGTAVASIPVADVLP